MRGEIAWQMNPEGARTAHSLEEVEMAKKVKRRAWTKSDVRELKTHARQKTPAPKIARAMKRTLIRYKAKPEAADENAELVAAVFAELKAARPEGVRYLTLRLEDDSFVHLVETAADDGSSQLPKLAAFQAFQNGIRERCAEPPVPRGATIVGNYRMLSET